MKINRDILIDLAPSSHRISENDCPGLRSSVNHPAYDCSSAPSHMTYDCPNPPSSMTRPTYHCSTTIPSHTNRPTYDELLSESLLQLLLQESRNLMPSCYADQRGRQTPPEDHNNLCSPSQSSSYSPASRIPSLRTLPMSSEPNKINPNRYKTELCRSYSESGRCRYAAKCQYAHGLEEVRTVVGRHPKYKTERCRTYHETGFCTYGPRCNFVHGESEHWEPEHHDPEHLEPMSDRAELWQPRQDENDVSFFVTSGSWGSRVNAGPARSSPLPCPGKSGRSGSDWFNACSSLNNSVGMSSQDSSSPSSRTDSPVAVVSGFESFRGFSANRSASFFGDGFEIPFYN